jgi:signal transduction histidine kinase
MTESDPTLHDTLQADEELIELIRGLAHELRNSLSVIEGFVELLMDAPEKMEDSKRTERYLRLVLRAAALADGSVSQIQGLCRDPERTGLEDISPGELAEEAVECATDRWIRGAGKKEVEVRVAAQEESDVRLRGPRSQLREMLVCLLRSAIESVEDGERVLVRSRSDGGKVIFEVEDTGSGLNPEEQRQCVQPSLSAREEDGGWLSLCVARGILRRFDGQIEVESQPDRGTTVRVSLPAVPGDPPANIS